MDASEARTSRYQAWRASGGTLGTSWRRLRKSRTLFPYWVSGKDAREAEGVKGYVYVTLVVLVAGVGAWVWWLDSAMGGGSRQGSGPLVAVDTAPEGTELAGVMRPTLMSFQQPTRTPTPTATRVVVSLTRTPEEVPTRFRPTLVPIEVEATVTPRSRVTVMPTASRTPTPRSEHLWIELTRYWPDEGPDWCLTWDEEAGKCVSPLTSGDDFRQYDGRVFACDPEMLGHVLHIPLLDVAYPCLDTGESFVCPGGPCTVGLLSKDEISFAGLYEAELRP